MAAQTALTPIIPLMKIPAFLILAAMFLAAGAVVLRAADSANPAAKPYTDLKPAEFDRMRSGTNTVLLDVRTPEEFAAGHIPGAINIDFNSPEFAAKISRLDTNKTYLVSCAVGGRSARACNRMAPLQFGKLYNLEGGFTAWQAAGKPVAK